jgi:hypothetical protein
MDAVLESLLKTDFKKELKKVSIFERCYNLSNIYENNKTNSRDSRASPWTGCTNCNKNANYICLIDNKHYCWYHTITWKEE